MLSYSLFCSCHKERDTIAGVTKILKDGVITIIYPYYLVCYRLVIPLLVRTLTPPLTSSSGKNKPTYTSRARTMLRYFTTAPEDLIISIAEDGPNNLERPEWFSKRLQAPWGLVWRQGNHREGNWRELRKMNSSISSTPWSIVTKSALGRSNSRQSSKGPECPPSPMYLVYGKNWLNLIK